MRHHRAGKQAAEGGSGKALTDVLMQIVVMENPPKQFLAGTDALAAFKPTLARRIEEVNAYEDLSKSTDGAF